MKSNFIFKLNPSGVKWKEKLDLMCCLPNKFPLPIFLLINKCDKIERVKRSPWLEKVKIENYIQENQFYSHFFISAEPKDSRETIQSSLSNQSVDIESPIKEMIKSILQFKDLKEKIIMNNNQQKIKYTKTNTNQSNKTANTKHTESSEKSAKSIKKDKNCCIL